MLGCSVYVFMKNKCVCVCVNCRQENPYGEHIAIASKIAVQCIRVFLSAIYTHTHTFIFHKNIHTTAWHPQQQIETILVEIFISASLQYHIEWAESRNLERPPIGYNGISVKVAQSRGKYEILKFHGVPHGKAKKKSKKYFFMVYWPQDQNVCF